MTKKEILEWGRQTLRLEADALQASAARLGEGFCDAIRLIFEARGKVIVTGLGKSGHVARKIAATLASTGTPAFFLHPTEALHGDSGVIGKEDVLLAIAFGGETREVVEVANFARRVGLKILALTGKISSSLAALADVVLDGSVAREACPLNLAPTTSTTVAMAIGDALAVALMHTRGMREEDFARFHPDGSLGRKLSLVSQHMHAAANIPTLDPKAPFHTILERVTQNNFGICAVQSDGNLEGVITDGDVRRAILRHEAKVFNLKAEGIMTTSPRVIYPNMLAIDALSKMEDAKITALFVVESEHSRRLVGLLRMHDLLAAKIV